MKLNWSGIGLTDGRGKLGGNILSRNRFGAYGYNFVKAPNPQTQAQQNHRGRWSKFANDWSTLLNSTQRAAWETEATNPGWEITPEFGDPFQPTGFELFMLVNMRLNTESGEITDPPTYEAVPPFALENFVANAGFPTDEFSFTTSRQLEPLEEIVVFATVSTNKGRAWRQDYLFRKIYQGGVGEEASFFLLTDQFNNIFSGIRGNSITTVRAYIQNTTTSVRSLVGVASRVNE